MRTALALLLLACGPSPAPERPRAPDPRAAPAPTPAADVRALAPDARFLDLVRAIRTLDDRRDQESSAGCLLREGWRLEADLAVAVRNFAAPPDDLSELAEDAGPINVLSRFGTYGDGDSSRLTFNALTTTLPPVREPAILWAISGGEVFVRSSAARAPTARPMDAEHAARALSPDAGALFVTAEAGTSLARLASVLRHVPESFAGRIAFATPLVRGTRLPAPPPPAEADASLVCPEGLAPPAEDALEGELDPRAIVGALGPLRQGAQACVSAAQGPGAGGAHVRLALRIGPDGRVSEACAISNDSSDAALSACLVRAVRATIFPAPDPPGLVDVALPLALSPLETQRQRPLCD